MIIWCWSVKGGVGTTVVAAATALGAATDDSRAVTLMDLDGDQPAVLGVDADRPGLVAWSRAGDEVGVDALERLAVPVDANLGLIVAGDDPSRLDEDRFAVALAVIDRDRHLLVVDGGRRPPPRGVGPGPGIQAVLVVRPCYLALRRVARLDPAPDRVVLVEEAARTLRHRDVAGALGGVAVTRLPWDPAVARAVDAGTLVRRLPRSLRRLAPR